MRFEARWNLKDLLDQRLMAFSVKVPRVNSLYFVSQEAKSRILWGIYIPQEKIHPLPPVSLGGPSRVMVWLCAQSPSTRGILLRKEPLMVRGWRAWILKAGGERIRVLYGVQQVTSAQSEIHLLRALQWPAAESPSCSWSQSQPWAMVEASARAEQGQGVEGDTRLSLQAHNSVLMEF